MAATSGGHQSGGHGGGRDGGDTIFALSTAAGRAGLAVIRLSGPGAGAALAALSGDRVLQPRRATLAALRDPASGVEIDRGLVLWFPAPASFTGEDVAELHLHGGRATIEAATRALTALPGLRPAEAGEFTRRAFDRGKLDLTEVEGLADLIAAETEGQRRQALRQLGGALSAQFLRWHGELKAALAHGEAAIDFSDEDLPPELEARNRARIEAIRAEIAAHLDDGRRGEMVRDGFSVAILGAPNVGKSSLLNALARRDAAIVSAIAGTTRDIVEVLLDLGGYPVLLADTAGLRAVDAAGGDPIEAEGIRRALARAEQADLRLLVFDAAAGPDAALAGLGGPDSILVANKIDRAGPAPPLPEGALRVSATAGFGLAELTARLAAEAVRRLGSGPAPAITRARHRLALTEARDALARSLAAALPELAAEDLRLALRALDRLTGRTDVEALLDIVFRDFCIGK